MEDLIRSGLKWKMEKGNQFMLGIIHSFQNSLWDRCGFDGTDSDSFRTFQTMKGIDDIQQVFSLIKRNFFSGAKMILRNPINHPISQLIDLDR